MVLVPALGARNEDLMQDTLKSMLVAFFALSASLVFFWQLRKKSVVVKLHSVFWLPVGLMLWALGSMAWSHAYLGGVEAIRWFLFSLLFFLGTNTLTLSRVTYLAWGIHLGAVIASLWAALQYWFDFHFFAQGPNPASTFVNRNFFAEFIVCTLPFSLLLLSCLKDKISVFFIAISIGFNITALMMTGTRSALLSLLVLLPILGCAVFLIKPKMVSTGWRRGHWIALTVVFLASVLCMGSIGTGNLKLMAESNNATPIDRALNRTASVASFDEYTRGSFSVRAVMWKATLRMIAANPITGVGAGAWEVQIPRYQKAGSQLETDYYAHNEFLQLIAEYGIAGWIFLLGLMSYLARAAYKTWADRSDAGRREAPLRTVTILSLFVFFLVSNAGFPWRMATTAALFALSLAVLAASDYRLGSGENRLCRSRPWKSAYSWAATLLLAICALLAVYISQRAIECESKLVRAIKIASMISQSHQPNDPRWKSAKAEMFELTRQGISINPHYRKLTPIIADAVAGWNDWKDSIWIWKSVLASRPYIVAMIANIARGYLQAGDTEKAQEYLNRGNALQPTAPTLMSLEVMLWSRTGREREAALRAKTLLKAGLADRDIIQTAFYLGKRLPDTDLTIMALEQGIKTWPEKAVDGWLQLGAIYSSKDRYNEKKAIASFRAAVDATPSAYKSAVLARIPPPYRIQIQ